MNLAFIGGGNMGEAMLAAILGHGLALPASISVSDVSQSRREYLSREYHVMVTADNRQAVSGKDVVVLAIKPQNLNEVMAGLKGQLAAGQLVISIIAGTRIETLRRGLGHHRLVRAMPNTPAQIGEGITVWTATPEVSEPQKAWAGSILGAMGKEIYVADEGLINMATAVSGSGPAYVFLFMESLIEAARQIGLPEDIAKELVLETVIGSSHFARKSGKPLAELRRMVTSPGGTTAEALQQLEKGNFSDLVKQAVAAAYNKAKSLGG